MDDYWSWIYGLVVVLLLFASAAFSAAEIGILSVNRFRLHQLAEDGSARARLLQRLLQQPARMLTAILILITTINYINEALTTEWLHGRLGLPEWVPFVSLLVLVMIVSEVTPISYAAANPEIVATGAAPMVALVTSVLRPVSYALTTVANGVLRLLGGEPRPKPLVTGEEVRTIVDIETERGVLEEEEKELIYSIFEFSDTIVREIMVPRIDITAVGEEMRIAEVIDLLVEEHYSRLPVYHDNLDHIIGIVNAKDLLPYQLRRETDAPVRQAMRAVTFVPETKHVSELLQEFRETKQTIAIVLDEYGGTAGLVTVEDLLEEIVGEIYDEYDVEQPPYEWIDENTLLVDGKLPVDEVSELLDYELPEGDYDTIGGFLYSRFGDVPNRGEMISEGYLDFIVDQLDGHRIVKVRIIRHPRAAENGNGK